MNLGFDGKRIFYNQTGLGNYSRSVIKGLSQNYPKDFYHLYSPGIKIYGDFLKTQTNIIRHFPETTLYRKFPSLWRSSALVNDMLRDEIELFHGLSNELPKGIEKSGIKSVVTIHDLIFLHFPKQYPWLDRNIYRKKFSSAIQRADAIIATSEHTKEDILHFFDTDPKKIQVIYQDCDPVFANPISDADKETLKNKYKLPSNFVLSVGTLEQRKNHLNLLKAFHQILPDQTDLVLVGKKADMFPALEKYVDDHHLQNRVKFIHQLSFEDLPGIYQLSSAVAYLSTYEGFGIPIVEAMRSQIPVLCSNISSLPEVAGEAAILVDPYHVEEIADGIQKLLFETNKRNDLLLKAKIQLGKFDSSELSSQLMETYTSLMK